MWDNVLRIQEIWDGCQRYSGFTGQGKGLVWLIGAMVCLHAARWVQLFHSADSGWLHCVAWRYHQLSSSVCVRVQTQASLTLRRPSRHSPAVMMLLLFLSTRMYVMCITSNSISVTALTTIALRKAGFLTFSQRLGFMVHKCQEIASSSVSYQFR